MATERKGLAWRAANWALEKWPDWVWLGLLCLFVLVAPTIPVVREIGAVLIALALIALAVLLAAGVIRSLR